MIPYSDPSEPGHVFPYVNLGFITGVILIWLLRQPHRIGRMRNYHGVGA